VKELVSPRVAVDAALQVIAEREPAVRAWAFLDADRARDEARHAPAGPLRGLTLGAKDIFDTGDQPSEYGSPIYAGYRPRADAAAVAQLRAAGAVVLGKTVTAELAWVTPGPTTNPHRVTHTPGGSSSGSAAAVAAGMVDLANVVEVFRRTGGVDAAVAWRRTGAAQFDPKLEATGIALTETHNPARNLLTAQELQVALALAQGITAKTAATQLFLSQKTVEYHLTRIYRKLEISTREELAHELLREYLVNGLPSG
jgi:DNA-binding CsgD family transcriptional regulator